MTQQEKYADKIAKLLAKAESTKSPEEAEMLFAKAQELMSQYAIDEAMLAAARGTHGDDKIVEEEFVMIGIYRFAIADMTWRVLTTNGLKVVKLSGKNWREVDGRVFKETVVYKVVGYKSDLDRARALQTSLLVQAIGAENSWWKKHKHLYSKEDAHYARRQFLFSFGHGVHEKLKEAQARGQAAAEAEHGSNSVALVLRDKSLAVQDEFNRRYPHLRKVNSSLRAGDAFAAEKGKAAGRKADVGGTKLGGSRKAIGR
jgi:hypothetical protein